jgi:hypothetical protein
MGHSSPSEQIPSACTHLFHCSCQCWKNLSSSVFRIAKAALLRYVQMLPRHQIVEWTWQNHSDFKRWPWLSEAIIWSVKTWTCEDMFVIAMYVFYACTVWSVNWVTIHFDRTLCILDIFKLDTGMGKNEVRWEQTTLSGSSCHSRL